MTEQKRLWVPQDGEDYWYVAGNGMVESSEAYDCRAFDFHKQADNLWQTQEQAQSYADACRDLALKMHAAE